LWLLLAAPGGFDLFDLCAVPLPLCGDGFVEALAQ
jgi:hypothetical protein